MPQEIAARIALTAVTSSNIKAWGYDIESSTLAVEFNSGDVWHYAAVPFAVAEAFHDAESKGKFYQMKVRGKFTADKMTGPCPKCRHVGWIGERCSACSEFRYTREERKAQ